MLEAFGQCLPSNRWSSTQNVYPKSCQRRNRPTHLVLRPTLFAPAYLNISKDRGEGGVLSRPNTLSPNIRYFVAILRFVANEALFGNLWTKKCFLGSKTAFLRQEVRFFMAYIAYHTELNVQICNYAQKLRICRKNSKYPFDEN